MFFYPLKFSFNLLQDQAFIQSLPKAAHTKIPLHYLKDILSNEILELFQTLNLDITILEIFYRSRNVNSNIHIDSAGGDYAKLNWIFGGKDSKMRWWKPKSLLSGDTRVSDIKTNFISYKPDEVDLLYEAELVTPSLVQVGIPHNVYNPDYEERYCFSLVYRKNNKRPTMRESVDLFYKHVDWKKLSRSNQFSINAYTSI